MIIIVGESKSVTDLTNAPLTLHIDPEHFAAFKQLVARGCNTWQNAPAAIQELHDLLYHGRILQQYR